MLDKVVMDKKANIVTLIFDDGRVVTLSSSKDTSIERFYEWFMSKKYYPLLTDEAWERTMEDTQPIINLKEVA